jgi:hypothetical protein
MVAARLIRPPQKARHKFLVFAHYAQTLPLALQRSLLDALGRHPSEVERSRRFHSRSDFALAAGWIEGRLCSALMAGNRASQCVN